MNAIIKEFESTQLRSDLPEFKSGDTIEVSVNVKEGNKTRIQVFAGLVIAVKGNLKTNLNASFTVRKTLKSYNTEKTFSFHSQSIASINVARRGDVRQSKIYYIRERSGKSARIKELLK